jgi:hypothetical protein
MIIKVYFEMDGYAEHVATFDSEETYLACFTALEALAKKNGFTKVTESLETGKEIQELK